MAIFEWWAILHVVVVVVEGRIQDFHKDCFVGEQNAFYYRI